LIASFLHLAESLFGGRLAVLAVRLESLALALLAAVWLVPPVFFLLRRWVSKGLNTRILYWTCFCGADNPPLAAGCVRCRLPPRLSWKERMSAQPWARKSFELLRVMAGLWRGVGWMLYYVLPAGLAWSLQMPSPAGTPALRTLFGALSLSAGLAGVLVAGRALGRHGGGPLPRAALLAGVVALAGFTALFTTLWAAAPYPPDKPLGVVHLFPDGRIRFMPAGGGDPIDVSGRREESVVAFQLRYAAVSWPLLQVRQSVPLTLAGHPLAPVWMERLAQDSAHRWVRDEPYRLRVVLLEQTFFAPPGGPYHLREPLQGNGLALIPATP
jgi:hypothetical protein